MPPSSSSTTSVFEIPRRFSRSRACSVDGHVGPRGALESRFRKRIRDWRETSKPGIRREPLGELVLTGGSGCRWCSQRCLKSVSPSRGRAPREVGLQSCSPPEISQKKRTRRFSSFGFSTAIDHSSMAGSSRYSGREGPASTRIQPGHWRLQWSVSRPASARGSSRGLVQRPQSRTAQRTLSSVDERHLG